MTGKLKVKKLPWLFPPNAGRLPHVQYAGHFRMLCLQTLAVIGIIILWLVTGHIGWSGTTSPAIVVYLTLANTGLFFGEFAIGTWLVKRRKKM